MNLSSRNITVSTMRSLLSGVISIILFGGVAIASAVFSPGSTLMPNCAPGTPGCTVRIIPDQAGNTGKFLTTDGAGNLSWATTLTALPALDTDMVTEGATNLYYTTARSNADFVVNFALQTTDDLAQGSTNKYYSSTLFGADFAAKTTDDLAQGSVNKYYSSSLFNSDLSTKTTDNVSEGSTNKYFTAARARTSLSSGSTPLVYDSSTGVFTFAQSNTSTDGYLAASDWNTFNNKQTSSLADGKIWIGNAGTATATTLGGDVSLSNTGIVTISNNAITSPKVTNKAITLAKIQDIQPGTLLGNSDVFAGTPQELSLGDGLVFSGSSIYNTLFGKVWMMGGNDSFGQTIGSYDSALPFMAYGAQTMSLQEGGSLAISSDGVFPSAGVNSDIISLGPTDIGGGNNQSLFIGNSLGQSVKNNVRGLFVGDKFQGVADTVDTTILNGVNTMISKADGVFVFGHDNRLDNYTDTALFGNGNTFSSDTNKFIIASNDKRWFQVDQVNGEVVFNGSTGSSGDILLSNGPSAAPMWSNASGLGSIGFTINASGTDISTPTPSATLGGNFTLNVPSASAGSRGVLSASDWSLFNGKENALAFDGKGLFTRTGNTITGLNTCTNGQTLVYNGTTWLCTTAISAVSNGLTQVGGTAQLGGTLTQNTTVTTGTFGLILNGSSATTGSVMALNANSLTSGNGLVISSTSANHVGTLLSVSSTSTAASVANGLARFNFVGAHGGSGLQVDDATITGNSVRINANALTTGNALLVSAGGVGTTKVATLTSGGTGATTDNLVLQYSGLATLATTNRFVRFLNNAGVTQGQISGTGTTGNVVYTTTSDARMKHDIVDTQLGLNDLLALKVRDYVMNQDDTNTRQTGFIAQELYGIYPQAVATNGDDGISPLVDISTPWGVDYGKVTPLLTKAIQDLNAKVDTGFVLMNSDDAQTFADPSQVASYVAAIQDEPVRNPVIYMVDAMNSGVKAVHDFVTERITAVRGYFDQVFANTSHQKTLCIGDIETEGETCITKAQLDMLLQSQRIIPVVVPTPDTVVDENTTDTTLGETVDEVVDAPVDESTVDTVESTPDIVVEQSEPTESTASPVAE